MCLLHRRRTPSPLSLGVWWVEQRLTRFASRMKLEDFVRFYADLDICCLCPDFLDGTASCHWKSYSYEGRWVAGISAGGCLNNIGP